ncbi:MAG: zinc-binding dehydrogenase, partial [Helcococcus sp.]|nr:zinc-binding dehydrogenase [Helcococcus sp.]
SMPIERIYDGKGLDAKLLTIVEPFCIGWHAVKRAKVKEGDKVLVVGSGTIGVLAALSAKQKGAEVYLCDVDNKKLNYVKDNFGFDGIICNDNPYSIQDSINRFTDGNGFDVTIEAVGLPQTFQNCIDSVAFGGDVVVVGVGKKNLDFNFTLIQKKELNIYGSRNALKEDFLELIDVVKKDKRLFEKVITNVYKLDDAKEAFENFDNSDDITLKVLIDFN